MHAAERVVARWLQAAKTIDLSHWGLDGLLKGQSITAYHGTTRSFTHFDLGRSRTELVNKFYGAGIFLVPSKRVAEQYAQANRNIGFEPSIIDDLKRKNPKAGAFMETLYRVGSDAWDLLVEEMKEKAPEYGEYPMNHADDYLGVNPNDLDSVCGYIIGSKVKPSGSGSDNELLDLFNGSPTGAPGYIYDTLDEIGLDSSVYRPKVYTVEVSCKNPLVTANKSQAKAARSKGYDCVIFYGSDLVGGVPEIAVFNPGDAKIRRVEVVD